MFTVTFLGHQGWLIATEKTCLLVDPLLDEEIAISSGNYQRAYPPRSWSYEKLPAVDGVFYTHSHEDHFDVRTLQTIDRSIPIHLPALSSAAPRKIVSELGFQKTPLLRGGVPVKIGDLTFVPLAPDHRDMLAINEWDTVPFVVFDDHGDGSFFSYVDTADTQLLFERAKRHVEKPGLTAYAWNALDLTWRSNWQQFTPAVSLLEFPRAVLDFCFRMSVVWGAPPGVFFSGGGFSFEGDAKRLNNLAFAYDPFKTFDALDQAGMPSRFFSPLPGTTVSMKGGELVGVEKGSPFVRPAPKEQWPDRAYRSEGERIESYEPVCGRKDFSESDAVELCAALNRTASALYGSKLFRELYSLSAEELEGRKATFALALNQGEDGAWRVIEYVPEESCFRPSPSENAAEEYAALIECWGSDLLAVARGEMTLLPIWLGHNRFFSAVPERITDDLFVYFSDFMHPLFDAESLLKFYRNELNRVGPKPLRVKAGRAAS